MRDVLIAHAEIDGQVRRNAEIVVRVAGLLQEAHRIAGRSRAALSKHVRRLIRQIQTERRILVVAGYALDEVVGGNLSMKLPPNLAVCLPHTLVTLLVSLEQVLRGTGGTDGSKRPDRSTHRW